MSDSYKSKLREQAEQKLRSEHPDLHNYSNADLEALLHELHVHQIELELQNESLLVAQTELDASYQQFSDLFDNAPIGYVVVDENKKIIQVNATACKMLDIPQDKLINSFFFRIIVDSDQEKFLLFFNRLIKTGLKQDFDVQMLASNGTRRNVQLTCLSVEAALATTYRIALMDITAKKKAELISLELAAEKIRVQILSDFLTGVSHDLRTPLSSLVLGIDLLQRSLGDHPEVNRVLKLRRQIGQLAKIIDQLFQMSAIDQLHTYNLKPVNITAFVDSITETLQIIADEKNQSLTCSYPIETILVNIDEVAISRAISNLIQNAINYSASGANIDIVVELEDKYIIITVKDSGIGISAEDLPHIFDRFYRTDKSRNDKTGGTGLGLAIAKKSIEAHHGRVEVESEFGTGSTFRLFLPLP